MVVTVAVVAAVEVVVVPMVKQAEALDQAVHLQVVRVGASSVLVSRPQGQLMTTVLSTDVDEA